MKPYVIFFYFGVCEDSLVLTDINSHTPYNMIFSL